jgi:hypothetical protein
MQTHNKSMPSATFDKIKNTMRALPYTAVMGMIWGYLAAAVKGLFIGLLIATVRILDFGLRNLN